MNHRANRTRRPITESVANAFLAKVDRSGSCWTWTGKVDGDGYGVFYKDGGDFRAPRVAYEIANGVSPGPMFVCHRCDNPACVRPGHLFLGTNRANTADRQAKGRSACGDRNGSRLHPDRLARGERQGSAKLTADDVRAIRLERARGVTQRELQARYGVSQGTISHIEHGRVWRHVV